MSTPSPLDTIEQSTAAGTYTIEIHYDEEASYEEGGDRFGYNVLAPNRDIVGGLWAIDGDRDYILECAFQEVVADEEDRIEQAGHVGAGFVGII